MIDTTSGEIVKPIMNKLKEWADGHPTSEDEMTLEVSGNAWHVYDLLAQQVGLVVVSNPAKTRLIAQARIKTDKFDALALTRLLASGFICDVWISVSRIHEQRALAAHRGNLRQ